MPYHIGDLERDPNVENYPDVYSEVSSDDQSTVGGDGVRADKLSA